MTTAASHCGGALESHEIRRTRGVNGHAETSKKTGTDVVGVPLPCRSLRKQLPPFYLCSRQSSSRGQPRQGRRGAATQPPCQRYPVVRLDPQKPGQIPGFFKDRRHGYQNGVGLVARERLRPFPGQGNLDTRTRQLPDDESVVEGKRQSYTVEARSQVGC